MAEKKTEIVVGFTNHTPSFVDKELANMKKADVILFEFPAYGIEQLKRGTMEPHHLAAKSNFPEAAERMFRALKRMSHDGKMVYGYEDVHNDRLWSREERARKNALDDATELPFKTRLHSTKSNLMKSARAFAELTKIRD